MRKSGFLPKLRFNISPFIRFYHMASTSGNVPRELPDRSPVSSKAAMGCNHSERHKLESNPAFDHSEP